MKAGMSARFHAAACAAIDESIALRSASFAGGDWVQAGTLAQITISISKRLRIDFPPGPAYNGSMSAVAGSSPFRVVHTVCSHDCPDSCGVLVTVNEEGRATKVQGDPSHPVTQGFLCGKVAKYLDRVYSPDRVLYPLKRKPSIAKGPLARGREIDAFERISWDEALDSITSRLQQVSDQ